MLADWAPGLFVRDWAWRNRLRLRFSDFNDASMWDEECFEDLEHHLAAKAGVRRPIDFAHAPGSKGRQDSICTEFVAGGDWHRAANQCIESGALWLETALVYAA